MKGSFIKNLHRAFVLTTLLLLTVSLASYITIYQSNRKAVWVNHTERVLEKLELLISNLKDAETGVRGYIITGDPETLEPYVGSYERTAKTHRELVLLTRDNATQQEALSRLSNTISDRYMALTRQVRLKREGKQVALSSVTKGKKIMDEARSLVKEMQREERRLLARRTKQWQTLSSLTPFLIVFITLVSILVTYYFCRELKIVYYKNTKLHRDLQRKSIETERRLKIIQGVADRVAAGDYSVRLNEKQSDILGNLATNLNSMAISLEYSFNAIKELMIKKDDFISIAAHELKTPLTSIKAYLQFIGRAKLESEEGKKVYPFIAKANEQTNRLTNIIKDLLDVARINEGQLALSKIVFSMREAVLEVADEIFYSIKTHELVLEGEPDLFVEADKLRIEQVLVNLISNAIKYSPGSHKIIVEVKQTGPFVRVSVRDFGIGIPKEKLPLVFERYFRVEESSQNYGGMGLGLYISKGIVEKHGGSIGVISNEGRGSTFWFTLPAAQK
ncbi:CHASE3 domain-containing protein [Pedobacter sp. SYSU D00535]|uniref:sensor histidine kinase n=1 Tax=Pedobacter sp. SYSU D00535 TaxID=2810308 RepID=UPI001A97B690|nr:CHASE3 domain-containing protein [Pedobacter sp. SYSU D00535]